MVKNHSLTVSLGKQKWLFNCILQRILLSVIMALGSCAAETMDHSKIYAYIDKDEGV